VDSSSDLGIMLLQSFYRFFIIFLGPWNGLKFFFFNDG
jgi:hypothetical protein